MKDKLKQIKDMYKIQKEAKKIKKELKNTHIEADENGVKIIIDGEQEVQNVIIPEDKVNDLKKLEKTLIKAFNKAIKKSQQVGAEKMKGVMGEMGLGM